MTLPRYRYLAYQLGEPFLKIAELPLSGVEWERLRNGSGTFRANLKLPSIMRPTYQSYEPQIDGNAHLKITASGDYVTTPDDPALDILTDFEICARVTMNDWTPGGSGQIIMSKWVTGGQQSWSFGVSAAGNIQVSNSTTGSNTVTMTSSAATGFADGTTHWIKAQYVLNNGGGSRVAKFLTSEDGEEYTQLGTTITTAGTTSIFNSTAPIVIGDLGTPGVPMLGKIHNACAYIGDENGDPVVMFNAYNVAAGATTFDDDMDNPFMLAGGAMILNDPGPPVLMTTYGDNELAKTRAALYKDATDRATTCIYVLRDNAPVGAWIIWDREYDSATQTLSLGGAELFSYWRRRIVEGLTLPARVTFTNSQTLDIAAFLMAMTNDINVVLDFDPGDTPIQDKEWRGVDAKWVADAVMELANQLDGFDFKNDLLINESGEFERRWTARQNLGEQLGATAKFTSNVEKLSVTERGDIRSNEAVTLGATVDEMIKLRPRGRDPATGTPLADFPFRPKLQTVGQLNDEEDTTRLFAYAAALRQATVNHQVIELTLAAGAYDAEINTLQPGDIVRLVIPTDVDPFFPNGYDGNVRTIGFRVHVPDTHGREIISLMTDDDIEALSG